MMSLRTTPSQSTASTTAQPVPVQPPQAADHRSATPGNDGGHADRLGVRPPFRGAPAPSAVRHAGTLPRDKGSTLLAPRRPPRPDVTPFAQLELERLRRRKRGAPVYWVLVMRQWVPPRWLMLRRSPLRARQLRTLPVTCVGHRAPCSLTSQISLIVVVARTTLIIAIAVVALFVALIAALIALAQIFECEVCL